MVIMRRILFFVLMLSSLSSLAADYYWEVTTGTRYTGNYPSPVAACQSIGPDYTAEFITETTAQCGLRNHANDWVRIGWARRMGDSCPEGTEYNPLTGECDEPEPDECEAKEGQEESLFKSGTFPDAFVQYRSADGMFFSTETTGCNGQCRVNIYDTRCKGKTNGDYSCWMTGVYTGEKCGPGGNEGEGAPPPDLSDPESNWADPTTTEDFKPCIYVVNSDGSKSCTSEQKVESEGQSCGVANGVVVCSPPSKPPKKEELTVETTISETTKPDGSTETVKTDKADYLTCVGKGCTSSTTTSTTTTTTDANGNRTGSSSTCTGPLCGDKNGAPGADGEGIGDCIIDCGDGEGEGEESDFDGGELGEVKDFGESASDFMERAGDAPIMQALSGLTFPSGGSCGFGAASTKIGTISLDGMCDNSHWLDPLYPIFLAAWCFAAIRKFMEA